ncbi:MAG TPA: glucosyl-3-phosphoglycerate synthase [Mycobacteriales bacterium]|jgi:glucosyl-3-phosphoglycerate synthase|nr:glucosyl-3-phosphoglycerate synthase [Mycobacteriales bacterium]
MDGAEWLARRTFHHSAFDPADLVARKGKNTVSVVLPALNEARTVGALVRCFRTELVERVPLVDELVVVDPGSTDGTDAAARDEGATVVYEADVLPEQGRVPGKGEAMWKSLAATTGDLVAWVDADIAEPGPEFVTGTLGPLLTDPDVVYVKGFYERPLTERGRLRPTGGGRVTELVARPWLSAFWPDLAYVIQPLAGEQAGRRAVLETLPFAAHYGVEIGLLIDVYHRYGMAGLAQVDLDRRIHRNQAVPQLGRMAFVIQHAILRRLAAEGRAEFREPPANVLRQFRNVGEDYRVVSAELPLLDRPPLRGVNRPM